MVNNKQEQRWRRIAQFMKTHRNKQKKFIAQHFINENHSKTTIYRIINKVNNNGQLQRQSSSALHHYPRNSSN
jgi:DeoR/GlpR family transcriptional regulator of sugar metabolism